MRRPRWNATARVSSAADRTTRRMGTDAERVSEDGSDDEPYGWRFQRPNAVQIAARVTEAAHHG